MWWGAAKTKKSEFLSTLSVLLRERPESLRLPAPFANHRVANKLYDQDFVPTNEHDPTDGFSVWDFPELKPSAMAVQLEATREWTEHLAGNNNPTMADTRAALSKSSISPIVTFSHLFAYITHFEVFLMCVSATGIQRLLS